nr:tlde1 domain-containing protein [Oligella ureolytica]
MPCHFFQHIHAGRRSTFVNFNIGALSVKAFSGMDEYRNKKQYHCMLNKGPIPLGKY